MPRFSLSPLALALGLAVGSCGDGPDQEDHTQALLDAREEWGRAIAEGDLEKILSFWTDDVVIYPVAEPAVRGIDAVRAYMLHNRRVLGIRPRVNPIEIVASASGDLGYIIGTHDWVDEEGRASNPGRYVTLWRRHERGEWRCFLEIHSPLPDEAAAGGDAG